MPKYLGFFPKPLLDDLVAGLWLPVVGAGMSMNAKIPALKKMPLWPDLGTALAAELKDYASASPLDAISAFQHEYGRAKLIERLTSILLIKEASPGEAHRAFCSIPFDIVCTTNFDFLLERQYDLIPRYVYPVVDEEQLSINVSDAGTQLLKLHGDLRHPSRLIVTEEDYDGFLARYPLIATYLANLLIANTAFFIGYSLDDPDFRQVWSIVIERLGRTRRMAYALMVDANNSDIARFERRGVKVINIPGHKSQYCTILTEVFSELREYIRDNVLEASEITEEEPLRELSLPRDAKTRLCFFSLPVELLSIYRSRVFPMVEELGFVPVTADDIISPGKNVIAKIDALIGRASAMVVDMASSWTRAEYDIALARNREQKNGSHLSILPIIVILSPQAQVSNSAQILTIARRNDLSDEAIEQFIHELKLHLSTIASSLGKMRSGEAQRLFDAREYRAAVISAMTELETSLWSQLVFKRQSMATDGARKPLTLRPLIDSAVREEMITPEEHENIRSWITVRNKVIHEGSLVTGRMARSIVDGVEGILKRSVSR